MLGFNVGLSALRSSQTAMDVIANNIANANTPGYHRQVATQVANAPVFNGEFWRGTGVSISHINQIASRTVEAALTRNISDLSQVDSSLQVARQIESQVSGTSGSLQNRLGEFFGELHELQGHPESGTQRGIVVAKAQTLSRELNSFSSSLTRLRSSTRQEIETELATVNGQLQNLADLNDQISRSQAKGAASNTLLDNHQQLVNQIAESIDIEVIPQQKGFAYQFAQGHVSVSQTAFSISAEFGTDGSVDFQQTRGGTPLTFGGGKLASHQDTLNRMVPDVEQRLDQLASGLIQTLDHIQATGIGAAGPFESLSSTRFGNDSNGPILESGLPFDMQNGDLFVSVHDSETGLTTQTRIPVNPGTESLTTIVKHFSDVPHLQAVLDENTNGLTIIAEPGFTFDFAGQLPSGPDRTSITGDAAISFGGSYSGDSNQDLDFRIEGTGAIGVSDDLRLIVTSANNATREFNIGQGYEPGAALEIGDGVEVTLGPGQLNDGDSFSVNAVSDPDTSRLLVGLGLNSFFNGSNASNISVSENIAENPGNFSTGRTENSGDGSNITRLLDARNQPFIGGELSFEDHVASMTSAVAIEVSELSYLRSDLGELNQNLERERESISGVDPNEELVQLLTYQRSFQAATRIITTMDETLAELMNIIR